jgi:uncharacterized membrane protein
MVSYLPETAEAGEKVAHRPDFFHNFTDSITLTTLTCMKPQSTLARVWTFYRDGFRSMTVGRTLWLLIAIKFFIMFAVLKIFFFPSFLGRYDREGEVGRENYVRQQLIERNDNKP